MLINKNNNYQVSSTHFVPSTLHRPSHLIFTTVLIRRFYLCPMWMRKSRLREITNLYTSHRYQGVGFQSRFHLTPEVEHILVKSLNFSELKFFCSIHLTSRVAIIIQGNNVYKGLRPLTRSLAAFLPSCPLPRKMGEAIFLYLQGASSNSHYI